MHDLGFPQDATQAVRDLYRKATPKIALPYAETGAVHIGRSSTQEDKLSLPLMFTESLLRWLRSRLEDLK